MRTAARCALLCLALLLLCADPVRAEQDAQRLVEALDVGPLEHAAEEAELDLNVPALLRGFVTGEIPLDPDSLLQKARALFLAAWQRTLAFFPGVMLPALLAALTARLAGGRGASVAQYVCCLAGALAEAALLRELIESIGGALRQTAGIAEAVFPLLAGLLAASGAGTTASMLASTAAFACRSAVHLFGTVGPRYCAINAAVAIAGSLNPRLSLNKLFGLLADLGKWAAGIAMTFLVGLLSVQGLLGAGYDSASVRAARYAVDNLLPVIGGEVADTLDAIISSARLVKNAAGVTGMALVVAVCVRPLLRTTAALICLRLAAAAMEPLGEDALAQMTERFAEVIRLLLIFASACTVQLLLLLGVFLVVGKSAVR